MVNHIILHLDEEFFNKVKVDKLRREKEYGRMTWEIYVARLFGLAKTADIIKKHDN